VVTARSTSNRSNLKPQFLVKEDDTNECVAPDSKSSNLARCNQKCACHNFVRHRSITWREGIHTYRCSISLSLWAILIGWVVDRGSALLSKMSWSTAFVTNLSDMTSPKMHLSTSLTCGMLTAHSVLIGLLRSYVPSSGRVESSLFGVVRVSPKSTPLWGASLLLVKVLCIDLQSRSPC